NAEAYYPNCKTAAQDGRYDIPSDDPAYGPWLDRDSDGIGCES
ncbi:MAG: excalibur calcium-binding domain-containing protein, partial [Mycobacterium sp.]